MLKPQSLKTSKPSASQCLGGWREAQAIRPPIRRMSEGVLDLCQKTSLNPSLPGYASPAEPIPFLTFFLFFSHPKLSYPKSSPRAPQGIPRGPENHQKIDLLVKKTSPGPRFYRFFGRPLFFSLFGSISGPFFMKNQWKKRTIISQLRLFFWTWRPLR